MEIIGNYCPEHYVYYAARNAGFAVLGNEDLLGHREAGDSLKSSGQSGYGCPKENGVTLTQGEP